MSVGKKVLRITQLGEPVLRQKAPPISQAEWAHLPTLVRAMQATMNAARGVGIAAPQVGVSRQLFIVASRPNARYPAAPRMKPMVMINARLLSHSEEKEAGYEGCLSIPGMRGVVPRYKTVRIAYMTLEGKKVETTLTGFIARIFQHEYDHVQGRVYMDRVEDTRTLMTESQYGKRIVGK